MNWNISIYLPFTKSKNTKDVEIVGAESWLIYKFWTATHVLTNSDKDSSIEMCENGEL